MDPLVFTFFRRLLMILVNACTGHPLLMIATRCSRQ